MKWKRSGFSRHYRKIKIEGLDLGGLLNKCIGNDVDMRNLRWKNPLESTVEVKDEDFDRLRRIAGHSYQMTVLEEGGAIPVFKRMKANIAAVTGALLLGALIFYQSLFVAEIRVDGYERLTETAIRETLADAGLYEGVRIAEDYSSVKAALYENHEEITWVGIFREGRLIKVTVAEAGKMDAEQPAEDAPVDIVADRSGMVERILPLQGNAKVQKGDYVNKGDVLISGAYEYQSSDYSRGDELFTMYSHAKGQVLAKAPRVLTWYFEKKARTCEPTGNRIVGLCMKLGDLELDTTKTICRYEASVRNETALMDVVKPLPLSIRFVRIDEVRLTEKRQEKKEMDELLAAALRQYAKEELGPGEEIAGYHIDYIESANVVKAEVLVEVLEDIGVEKEIKRKAKRKNNEETSSE